MVEEQKNKERNVFDSGNYTFQQTQNAQKSQQAQQRPTTQNPQTYTRPQPTQQNYGQYGNYDKTQYSNQQYRYQQYVRQQQQQQQQQQPVQQQNYSQNGYLGGAAKNTPSFNNPNAGSKHSGMLFIALILAIVILFVGFIYVVLTGERVEEKTKDVNLPDVITTQDVQQKEYENYELISLSSNKFVFSDEILVERENVYEVGDEVIVYSVFEDFEQQSSLEGVGLELAYGISVEQPNLELIYPSLSNPELFRIKKSYNSPVKDYYFTAIIPTNGLYEGNYDVKVNGMDKITGNSVSGKLMFELTEPTSLKLTTLQIGEFDAVNKIFYEKEQNYYTDDTLEAFFEVRGFDFINNTPNIEVDMYITDSEGNILHDVSKSLVYTNDITYSTVPVQMLVNLNVPLNNLISPGNYNLQLLAKDKVVSISSLRKAPFKVIKRKGQII